jgi:hypothetical protein
MAERCTEHIWVNNRQGITQTNHAIGPHIEVPLVGRATIASTHASMVVENDLHFRT